MALERNGQELSPADSENVRSLKAEMLDQAKLAAPVCLGMLCNRFVSTCSTVMVGRQGKIELAAVQMAVSLANVSGYSILVGVAGTLQTTTGQAFGARNFTEVSLSLQRCILLCTFMLGIISAFWLNAERILHFIGQDEEVSSLAAKYLVLLLPGVFCYMLTQCLQNWLAAQRITSPAGTGGIINAALYLPLCWTFVHPLGFSFVGAAIATSLSNLFLMLWMIIITRRLIRNRLVSSWQGLSMQAFKRWWPFIRLALPNFLMISEWWASEITVLLAGLLPQAALSLDAMGMMAITTSICFMTPLSLSIAVNTRVSNELGAGQPEAAAHASRASRWLGVLVTMITSLILVLFRREWASLFTTSPQVIAHAMPILSLTPFYVIADGMAAVFSGSLKGCGRHAILAPVIIASYYFVGLPCSFTLTWPLQLGTFGLALGSTIGTVVHCCSFFILVLTVRWPVMAQQAQARMGAASLLRKGNSNEAVDDGQQGG